MREIERVYEGEVMPVEGWQQDESGLPIFAAYSEETIDNELIELRSWEGEYRLRMAAVLAEASDERKYGHGSLRRTCERNQLDYTTGGRMVTGYKRLRGVEIPERSGIVAAILSGELYWSKVEIAASVDDDEEYVALLEEAANGDLSASDMRERVRNHRALGTGENEWYTPPDVLEDVRRLLGRIELDPASSDVAQSYVKAGRYFSKEDDALTQEWRGKVFLNPPYSQPAIEDFAVKMAAEYRAGRVTEAVMLTHNYTDTRWFHIAESVAAAICFTRGRIKFVSPDGELAAPTQGQAFFYYGERADAFREVFEGRGFIR